MTPALVIAGTLAIITVACFVAMTLTYIFEVRREDRLDREEARRRRELVRVLGDAMTSDRPRSWTEKAS